MQGRPDGSEKGRTSPPVGGKHLSPASPAAVFAYSFQRALTRDAAARWTLKLAADPGANARSTSGGVAMDPPLEPDSDSSDELVLCAGDHEALKTVLGVSRLGSTRDMGDAKTFISDENEFNALGICEENGSDPGERYRGGTLLNADSSSNVTARLSVLFDARARCSRGSTRSTSGLAPESDSGGLGIFDDARAAGDADVRMIEREPSSGSRRCPERHWVVDPVDQRMGNGASTPLKRVSESAFAAADFPRGKPGEFGPRAVRVASVLQELRGSGVFRCLSAVSACGSVSHDSCEASTWRTIGMLLKSYSSVGMSSVGRSPSAEISKRLFTYDEAFASSSSLTILFTQLRADCKMLHVVRKRRSTSRTNFLIGTRSFSATIVAFAKCSFKKLDATHGGSGGRGECCVDACGWQGRGWLLFCHQDLRGCCKDHRNVFGSPVFVRVPRKSKHKNVADVARMQAEKEAKALQAQMFSFVEDEDGSITVPKKDKGRSKGKGKDKSKKERHARKRETNGREWESNKEVARKRCKGDEDEPREESRTGERMIQNCLKMRTRGESAKDGEIRRAGRDRTKKVVEDRSSKGAAAEAAQRRQLADDAAARVAAMPSLRERSRQDYLSKRELQQIELLRKEIVDDEVLFRGMKVSKKEKHDLVAICLTSF
ncbi:hypothetical protein DFH11DRAFT_1745166 [Phellopilus nigrolimitatus]|nr:hypothetical protein DFH11DRAFT_1745166 [Phellopilus nigrolimitatus]